MKRRIRINGLYDIVEFNNRACCIAAEKQGDITLRKGKFFVDACSLLGVLSLQPYDPEGVTIEYPDNESTKDFDTWIQQFEIKGQDNE